MKRQGAQLQRRVLRIIAAVGAGLVAPTLPACSGPGPLVLKGPGDGGVPVLPTTDSSTSAACPAATSNYGDCQASLGWGFDGKVCRPYTGCDCGSECDRLFPTARECAHTCARQGTCNPSSLIASGIARFSIGGSCDSLIACVPAGLEGELELDRAGGCVANPVCVGALWCVLKNPGTIDADFMGRACVDSLLAGVTIRCFQRLL